MINIFQNPVLILGGISQDPYHLNIFQFPIQIMGTPENPPVALSYTSTGGFLLGSSSIYNINYNYNYITTGGFLLGSSSIYNINYNYNYNYITTGGFIINGINDPYLINYKYIVQSYFYTNFTKFKFRLY